MNKLEMETPNVDLLPLRLFTTTTSASPSRDFAPSTLCLELLEASFSNL